MFSVLSKKQEHLRLDLKTLATETSSPILNDVPIKGKKVIEEGHMCNKVLFFNFAKACRCQLLRNQHDVFINVLPHG